jgi:peptidylprolyl isomerase
LQGVKIGSRVMLVIPPGLGYGKQGSGPNIPGGSTLVFVIDVLAAG